VLSREHLVEFPDDVEVGAASEQARRSQCHDTLSGGA
jgi:hypothetical protein